MRFSLALVLFLSSVTGYATTWSPTKVTDPISGDECDVHQVASYGSYIYQWESKYDGVYWPFTDEHWYWDCDESGYISFGSDFSDLTDEEVDRISDYLGKNPLRYGGKLERLEEIYKLRNKGSEFWARFYRVKAYWHQRQAELARREAVPLLENHIATLAPSFELVQTHFVLGDYYRRFSEPSKAEEQFSLARSVQWINDEGLPQTGSEYIEEMIRERLAMMQREVP